MKKRMEESSFASYRIGKTANTRLVRSSQMPKNFFSSQSSTKLLPKTTCSYIMTSPNDKDVFE